MKTKIENDGYSIKYFSLRHQVVEMLRKEILKGVYQPGDRIVESEIASRLGISRGPVREAIRQLEQEGLLSYSNNKGCSVSTLTPEDAWEIYLLRANLESFALRLCEGDIGDQALKTMEKCVDRMDECAKTADLNEMVDQDNLFHSLICGAPGKKRLLNLWSSLNSSSYAIFLTVMSANLRSFPEVVDKHRAVMEVLKTKNLEAACKAITDHYLETGRELLLKGN